MSHPDSASEPNGAPQPGNGRIARAIGRLVRLVLLVPVLAGLAAIAGVGALLLYFQATLPDPMSLRPRTSGAEIRILAADGSVLDARGAARDYMPLDFLSPNIVSAVVATEDRRFFQHFGLDPVGVARAMAANLAAGRFVQGGSTLTQQLAKNLFLTPDRTLARKLEEMVLSLWLELRLTKRDILELYLNRVYFGGGAHGIEAAARRYFGRSARDISLAEAAVIAGLLKAPSKYAPSGAPEQAIARGRVVLSVMVEAGFITQREADAADIAGVRFSKASPLAEKSDLAYAIDFVMDSLPEYARPADGDIAVETTLDSRLQRQASEIVARELATRGDGLAASQAAVIVLEPFGAVRAIVGGRSYQDSQFNRAIKARRQPGSAFKPLVYLAALDAGRTPDSMLVDAPVKIGAWSPRNDGGRYYGNVTMREALARSLNTVAVRLMLEAGTKRVVSTARSLGIRSPLGSDASLALGTSEVSLMELAQAYCAFANGGSTAEPYVVQRIRSSSGETLYARNPPRPRTVIASPLLAAMNDMLANAMAQGTGRRAQIAGHAAGGKTGTSQHFRDAWFMGFTAHLVGGVWVGNDDGRTMNRVVGGSLPADIWREVMTAAHTGLPALPLPPAVATAWSQTGAPGGAGAERDAIARVLAAGTLDATDRAAFSPDRGSASIVVRPPPMP